MFVLIVTEKGGSPKRQEFDKDEITIGRVPGNDVILPKGNVSKRHSRVVRQDGRFFVVDLKSTNGTYLNGRRITTPSPIKAGDKIYVGDFVISLDAEAGAPAGDEANFADLGEPESLDATPPPEGGGSSIEPIPLDQEPPDSQPPPPPMPRPSASLPSPSRPAIGQVPNRPTSPPPRLSSAGGLPRPPTASPSSPMPALPAQQQQPAVRPSLPSMGAPPRASTLMGTGSPSMPAARNPAPEARPTSAPPRMPSATQQRPPAPAPEPEPLAGEDTPPPMQAAEPAPVPARVAPSQSSPAVAPERAAPAYTPSERPSPASVPSLAGMPAVLQPAAAATSGFEARAYASVLAGLLQEARAAGAVSSPERSADPATRARLRAGLEAALRRAESLPEAYTPEQVLRDATAELAGTGAFEVGLEDPSVTLLTAEPSGRVWWARSGPAQPAALTFSAPEAVLIALDRLLSSVGQSRGERRLVHAALADGTRLHAFATTAGWHVALERAPLAPSSMATLVSHGVLTAAAAAMLSHALKARRNVVVAGPAGSGRTTVLAALVGALEERTVVVESTRELGRSLSGPTVVEAGDDWASAVNLAVNLRPSRLVLGEGTEAAAAQLISSLSTGSEGMLAVAEGPSGLLALGRMASQAARAGALTRDEALGRLALTRPLVVVTARLGDGSVRVVSLGEARAAEGGGLHVDEAFTFRVERGAAAGRLEGSLAATGLLPGFAHEL